MDLASTEYPLRFLLAALVTWFGGFALFGLMSGWWSLARRFRGTAREAAETVWFGSAAMDGFLPLRMELCFRVSAGREGVGISVVPPFSAVCPPLLIPWSDMRGCRAWEALGLMPRFRFLAADVEVTLHGGAARMLRTQFVRLNPERPLLTVAP